MCLFGFSGGGTWSAMTAGSDRRFKYMVMLGGGIYDLGKAMKHLPVIQKDRYLNTGDVMSKNLNREKTILISTKYYLKYKHKHF